MKPSIAFVISLTAVLSASAQTLPSLFDALRASGASIFADQINADPSIAALYLSNQVQTVFAPKDDYNGNNLRKRQSLTPAQQQALLLQCTQGQATIQSMRTLPGGSQIVTQDNSTLLKGKGQSVVSDARHTNASIHTTSTAAKRDFTHSFYPPSWSHSAPSVVNFTHSLYPSTWSPSAPSLVNVTRSFYPSTWTTSAHPPIWSTSVQPPIWTTIAPTPTWTTSAPPTPTPSPSSLVQIYSGLGNSVNVIQGDILYAGGRIQITDG
jgi:hypothetical protein